MTTYVKWKKGEEFKILAPDTEPASVGQKMTLGFLNGDANEAAAVYTEDAILYGPGQKFESHSKETLRDEMAAMFRAMEIVAWDAEEDIETVDGVAYCWGKWLLTARLRANDQRVQMRARTLDVRRRQADGTWRMVIDHASMPMGAKLDPVE